ncbi:MAG: selenocysteine-specific translation elongation factor, partial [Oscillospiraceae bacterium]|nr:selenocysteine-specific translation elongation factor [Oscillospiraceae bacterium]
RFVSNMLAGAGGIDLALLAVAADDGVMPQTREHLSILELLQIKSGIIVITKADLAEPDWIELVAEDIRGICAGSFLEGAQILAVSAHTGQGIEELREAISGLAAKAVQKNSAGPFRIPVDRVFSVEGFGTVITGTMMEGTLCEGDEVQIYPTGLRARVRSLQNHSQNVTGTHAGQRVAVNLAGIKRESISRGDTLAAPGSMPETMMLDVKLRIIPDSARVIENGSRLHFYHGARESLCKLVLLDADRLEPGGEGFAQLRFTENIAAKKADPFILRFYSPLETVGGGIILDPAPKRKKRNSEAVIQALSIREQGGAAENLLQAIADSSARLSPLHDIRRHLSLPEEAFKSGLQQLAAEKRIYLLGDKAAIDAGYKAVLEKKLRQILADYHDRNPLQEGMRRDELRSRLLPGRDAAAADHILGIFAGEDIIAVSGQIIALADFKAQSGGADPLAEKIGQIFLDAGYAPPSAEEINALFPKEKGVRKVLEALLARGVLVSVAPQMYFHKDIYDGALAQVIAFITREGQITLAQMRDISGTSRKFALALLEHFDRRGLTKKVGDARILGRKI